MAKKKTLSSEYKKARANLLKKIRRAEKKGYVFDEGIVPKIPKRPTLASINRLKSISKNLYKKAVKLDIETGEIIPGEESRKAERSAAARKAAETRAKKQAPQISIIDTIIERLQLIPETRVFRKKGTRAYYMNTGEKRNELINIIYRRIDEEGEKVVNAAYITAQGEIFAYIDETAHESDGDSVERSFVYLATILKGSALSFNEAENISEMAEFYEN